MSITSIRAALEVALKATDAGFATAWENAPFTAPALNLPWQQVNLLFATPDNREAGAFYTELGFLQVTLKYPLQSGPAAAAARAIALRTAFRKGISFSSGGVITQVVSTPSIGNGVADGDRWSLPVKIPFKADIPS